MKEMQTGSSWLLRASTPKKCFVAVLLLIAVQTLLVIAKRPFSSVLVTSSSAFVPYFVPFMLLGALRRDSNLDRGNWQRFCIVVSLSVFAFFESTLLYCYNSMQFVGKGLYVGMAMMGLFIAAYALVLLCLWKRRKIDPEIAG